MLAQADALRMPLANGVAQCIISSPPYWGLRDYGLNGRGIGLEPLHDCLAWARSEPPCGACYVCHLRAVARECWRVLRDDGTMWLNLGDSYASKTKGSGGPSQKQDSNAGSRYNSMQYALAGIKSKDLAGVPWRVALALQADGWYLRSEIIWAKPNPMPESVTDRPTKAHEQVFLLTKRARYYWDADAVREPAEYGRREQPANTWSRTGNGKKQPERVPGATRGSDPSSGRNRRSVWTIATAPFSGAHFATFPPALVEPMVLAGSSPRACEHCGAPWERTTEPDAERKLQLGRGYHDHSHDMTQGMSQGKHMPAPKGGYVTTGWRSTCSHDNAGTGQCLVLDPFCGSGTVGKVAALHGRRFIGLDLSPAYLADLALARSDGLTLDRHVEELPLFGVKNEHE